MAQFLTFGIDEEIFAISVTMVQEILDVRPISRLPRHPPEIAGLIDVRGRSVTVIDLRLKLGLPPADRTDAARIIILDAENTGAALGLLADRVHEVADLETESLETAAATGRRWDATCIEAIGRWRDRFVIVLDVPSLLGTGHAAPERERLVATAA